MLLIRCPWCGFRDQSEFQAQGEAHIVRPENPYELDEEQWGQYLFFRNNPKGVHYERWIHVHGCRRWFNVVRNTQTDYILATYRPDEPVPVLSDEETSKPA